MTTEFVTAPTLDALQAMIAELSARPSLDASEFYEIVRRMVMPALSSMGYDVTRVRQATTAVGMGGALTEPTLKLSAKVIDELSLINPEDTLSLQAQIYPATLVKLMMILIKKCRATPPAPDTNAAIATRQPS